MSNKRDPLKLQSLLSPDGVRLDPDVGVTEGVLRVGVGVGFAVLAVRGVTELLDGLVDRHVVRQHVVAHQKLQPVPSGALTDEHSSL